MRECPCLNGRRRETWRVSIGQETGQVMIGPCEARSRLPVGPVDVSQAASSGMNAGW